MLFLKIFKLITSPIVYILKSVYQILALVVVSVILLLANVAQRISKKKQVNDKEDREE